MVGCTHYPEKANRQPAHTSTHCPGIHQAPSTPATPAEEQTLVPVQPPTAIPVPVHAEHTRQTTLAELVHAEVMKEPALHAPHGRQTPSLLGTQEAERYSLEAHGARHGVHILELPVLKELAGHGSHVMFAVALHAVTMFWPGGQLTVHDLHAPAAMAGLNVFAGQARHSPTLSTEQGTAVKNPGRHETHEPPRSPWMAWICDWRGVSELVTEAARELRLAVHSCVRVATPDMAGAMAETAERSASTAAMMVDTWSSRA